jgi:regulator of RNase E activity RraA
VPDAVLERVRSSVTVERAWTVLRGHGFTNQVEGGWHRAHPDRILVGRAVTAAFVPKRPDLHALVDDAGHNAGYVSGGGGQNSWVIQQLRSGDVLVADMMGRIKDGPIVGDVLSNYMGGHGVAGAVINGGIRDVHGIPEIPGISIFCRGIHPSHIIDATLLGVNYPLRMGDAMVLPGDVVLGTVAGVIFIPPRFVEEIIQSSEDVAVRDRFAKLRVREGRYGPGVIDRLEWPPDVEEDFTAWRDTVV